MLLDIILFNRSRIPAISLNGLTCETIAIHFQILVLLELQDT